MTSTRRTLLTLLAGVLACAVRAADKPELMGPPSPLEKLPSTSEIIPATPPPETPTVAAPAESLAPAGPLDDLFGRFLPRIGYSYDGFDAVGRDGGLSAFQLFVPVWQDRDSSRLVFSDSRLLIFDQRGTVGANLGVGGRLFSETLGRTVGGYVYYDYSDTGRASFNQVSGGVEMLGDRIDARANFYVPVGKDRKQVDQFFVANPEPYFQGNQLLTGGGAGAKFFDQALYGFDAEAGLKMVALEGLELRAFAGMYNYQGEAAQQAWGPRGRLEARLRDSLAVGVSIQNDRLFGTTVNCNCLISYGRLSGRAYTDGPSAPLAASDRLGDPVVRTQQVAVTRQRQDYFVAGTPMIDPRTNQPYLFLHVANGGNSDGSFENPYSSLGGAFADPRFAGGNLVVYDRTSGTYAGNVTFAPGTRLLSSAPVQVLETKSGTVVLPFSGAGGAMPRIHGTLAVASHSTISGFDLVGSGNGAVVGGFEAVRDVTLSHNRFSGEGAAAWLPSVAGLTHLHNNTIIGTSAGGFLVSARGEESATVLIHNNQITKPTGDAISVTAMESSRVEATIEKNHIDSATGTGVLVSTGSSARATLNATVRENVVIGSGGAGGVAVLTTGKIGGSRVTADVSNNELMENESPGFTARATGPNMMALDLNNNRSISSKSMFGFLLQQQKKATFYAVDPSTLGSRNTGSVTSAGTIEEVTALPRD